MAVFKIDIEKHLGGNPWTNRYLVRASSVAEAENAAAPIFAAEVAIHRAQITFDKYRVSDIVEGTDNFTVVPFAEPGNVPKNGAFLPLHNVMRADFPAQGGGRPSRKYWRIGLCAGDVVSDFTIDSTLVTLATNTWNTLIALLQSEGVPLVDPDDQMLLGCTVYPAIAMRQLRRGSRAKTEPIL